MNGEVLPKEKQKKKRNKKSPFSLAHFPFLIFLPYRLHEQQKFFFSCFVKSFFLFCVSVKLNYILMINKNCSNHFPCFNMQLWSLCWIHFRSFLSTKHTWRWKIVENHTIFSTVCCFLILLYVLVFFFSSKKFTTAKKLLSRSHWSMENMPKTIQKGQRYNVWTWSLSSTISHAQINCDLGG